MANRLLVSLELDREPGGTPVPVAGLALREEYSAGWVGRAVLALAADTPLGIGEIFGAVLARGVVPGSGAILHLSLADEAAPAEDRGRTVRSWPCVIDRIEPESPPSDGSRAECVVELADPIRRLLPVPIRAVFAGSSVGEMTGGALSLAAGMDGAPTLSPVLPRSGALTVVEETRDALASIPYAIACGESLGEWLERVHAPLGVRGELLGLPEGGLEWTLSDRIPGGEPVEMSLESDGGGGDGDADGNGGDGARGGDDGSAGGGGAGSDGQGGTVRGGVRILAIRGQAGLSRRGAALDDIEEPVLWRFDSDRPVGTLIEGAGIGPDEAWRRAAFEEQRALLELLTIEIGSREPELRPGSLVRIEGLEIADIERWQVGQVVHEVRGGRYANRALLLRGDAAWRPRSAALLGPRIATAVVAGEEGTLPNEPVPRDRLGRIPVRIPIAGDASSRDGTGAESRIVLPVVQPMAGALHGFAPAHRNGDTCRVTVHHPFSAEIDGFRYREGREVYDGGSLAPGWAGIIVEHDGGMAWSGWTFERADEDSA